MTIYARFNKYVEKTETCWLWTGGVRGDGYGVFAISPNEEQPLWLPHRRQVSVHRFALAQSLGRWPELQALHKCDTPLCVRPDPEHVYEGTHARNMRDKVEHGRAPQLEKHGRTKLTADDVRALRAGAVTAAEIAHLRGVTYDTAYHARDGLTWKGLDT